MRSKWMNSIASLILAVGLVSSVYAGNAQNRGGIIVLGSLTQTDTDSLLFMREEEKLARDVYTVLGEIWQNPVFSRIAASEQNHMDAIKSRLDAYGLNDPAQAAGVFTNSELQALYNSLIKKGSVSELEALKVGALIEEVDIQDLQNALSATSLPDLQRVYQNLESASENHLRAFVRSLQAAGESYTPQVLSSDEIQTILSATNSQGQGRQGRQGNSAGRNCQGNGGNRGANCSAQNPRFVDANGDGICDRMGTGTCSGQKAGRGRNNSNARNGR